MLFRSVHRKPSLAGMEPALNSQEALAKIVEGVKKFQAEVYPAQREMFENLKASSSLSRCSLPAPIPELCPTCSRRLARAISSSSETPETLCLDYSDFVGGVSAGVEYAMLVLKVPLVIICGHTDCGVMKSLLHAGQAHGLPAMQEWMRHASDARHRVMRDHVDAQKRRSYA